MNRALLAVVALICLSAVAAEAGHGRQGILQQQQQQQHVRLTCPTAEAIWTSLDKYAETAAENTDTLLWRVAKEYLKKDSAAEVYEFLEKATRWKQMLGNALKTAATYDKIEIVALAQIGIGARQIYNEYVANEKLNLGSYLNGGEVKGKSKGMLMVKDLIDEVFADAKIHPASRPDVWDLAIHQMKDTAIWNMFITDLRSGTFVVPTPSIFGKIFNSKTNAIHNYVTSMKNCS